MKTRLVRLGFALLALATTMSALLVVVYNPLALTNPRSLFPGAAAASGCAPRPTLEVPTDGPPITVPQPTIAPSPTPGPPPPVVAPVLATLEHPLSSKKQVLRHLLKVDNDMATWENPWCVETLQLEPGRIKFKQYASEFAYSGVKQPRTYRDLGPIWIVSIKGNVYVSMPCMSCTSTTPPSSGMSYIVSKNTGVIGTISAWAPAK